MSYTSNTYRIGNAEIIVYRPDLSAEERVRREASVMDALGNIGRSVSRKRKGEQDGKEDVKTASA